MASLAVRRVLGNSSRMAGAIAHVPHDQRRHGHVGIPQEMEYYKTKGSGVKGTGTSRRAFQYVVSAGFGIATVATAKVIVNDFLDTMSTSADVKAMAQVEVELDQIDEGKNVVLKWQGKPLFVRHRTQEEIDIAKNTPLADLKDQNLAVDADRVKDEKWLVLLGICTHLGCVPISHAGEYKGYFCPCHGSHYDVSGRIRKGPAPYNLEIPKYKIDGSLLTVG